MTRSGNIAGVLALLAALLVGSPASGQDSDKLRTTDSRLRALEDAVREIRDSLKYRSLEGTVTKVEMDALYARLERLERSIELLNSRATARRALSIDPDPRPRVRNGTGTIVIDNQLAVTATVWVDGVSYRVGPFSTRTLRDQPTGVFRYSAKKPTSDWSRVKSIDLEDGETRRITVFEQ